MADNRRPSAAKRQGFLEGLIAKKGKSSVAKDEPARDSSHSLPNGIFSIEAMRFSSLFLGAFGGVSTWGGRVLRAAWVLNCRQGGSRTTVS
jgi:hypothetical protein